MVAKDDEMKTCIRCTPLPSIDLVVMDTERKVLLGKRKNRPAQNLWFVPGGRILKNEPLREALARISLDEIGIELARTDVIVKDIHDHMYDDNLFNEEFGTHYVAICCWYLTKNEQKPSMEKAMLSQHHEVMWRKWIDLLGDPQVHENVKSYFLADPASRL
jgi:colanic acid biosynthesis protein WcaH